MSSVKIYLPITLALCTITLSIGGCLYQISSEAKPKIKVVAPEVTKAVDVDAEALRIADKDASGASQYQIYLTYTKGLNGVSINTLKAEDWLIKAAERGHLESIYLLAEDYSKPGYGVNIQKSVELFTRAAKNGHAKAQVKLGDLYLQGNYLEKDYAEAMRWYKSAAKQATPDAEYNIGLMYKDGKGVEQSPDKAVSHFRVAANAGHPEAQYNMGLAYYAGYGVNKDLIEAEKWLKKALTNGSKDAAVLLGVMKIT